MSRFALIKNLGAQIRNGEDMSEKAEYFGRKHNLKIKCIVMEIDINVVNTSKLCVANMAKTSSEVRDRCT